MAIQNPFELRHIRSVWLVATLLATSFAGCAHPPPTGPYVRSLALEGVRNVSARGLRGGLATRPPRRFDELELERDRTRVQRYYEQRGYFAARVQHAEGRPAPDGRAVDVVVVVEEGPATRIGDVEVFGLDTVDAKTRKRLQQYQLGQRRGQVFEHESYTNFKHSLARELTKRGYVDTKIEGVVDISPTENLANIRVTLFPRGVTAARTDVAPPESRP